MGNITNAIASFMPKSFPIPTTRELKSMSKAELADFAEQKVAQWIHHTNPITIHWFARQVAHFANSIAEASKEYAQQFASQNPDQSKYEFGETQIRVRTKPVYDEDARDSFLLNNQDKTYQELMDKEQALIDQIKELKKQAKGVRAHIAQQEEFILPDNLKKPIGYTSELSYH